jgi:transposase
MIPVPAGLRVLIATKPVDFRRGADGLAALVRETLGEDPFSGTIYVFRSKRADRVKMVAWDGTGLVLLWKRLESGAFKWPPITDGVMRLTSAQLAALVDGMDWSRLHARDIVRLFESGGFENNTAVRESDSIRSCRSMLPPMISIACENWWLSSPASAMRRLQNASA